MSTTVGGKVRSNDGTAIAFSRLGNGRPIISVDGAVAHRSFNAAGAELASLLAPRFTVVTYDRRGRGESGDTPPYAPAREVEDLEALIAEVGGSAFVVAVSSGCATALDAAARDIGIEKLALYEPSFIVDDSRPAMPTDYVARLKSLVAGHPLMGPLWRQREDELRQRLASLLEDCPHTLDTTVRQGTEYDRE